MVIRVRRGPQHELGIQCRSLQDGGAVLVSVETIKGPAIVWEDMAGETYPSIAVIRRVLLSRMRALHRGEAQMTQIDRVMLTPAAVARWEQVAEQARPALAGLAPDDVPTEDAEVLPDGRLRIFVNLPNRQVVETILASTEWRWRDN